MNKWAEKSIKLANSRGYLDRLLKIYPVEISGLRSLTPEVIREIKTAFNKRNAFELTKVLLKLKRFPVDDPYIASLRKHPYLLTKNPKTIKRLGRTLFSLKVKNLLKLAVKPKSPSRQFGHTFRKWLWSQKYTFYKAEKFKKSRRTSLLKGSDSELKKFVTKELNIKNLRRKPDFVFKTKNKFVVGEAKFLSDYGGTQNNQFDGALRIAKLRNKRIMGVAILDGIIWFKSKSYMHKTAKKAKVPVLSALLLKEFINNL